MFSKKTTELFKELIAAVNEDLGVNISAINMYQYTSDGNTSEEVAMELVDKFGFNSYQDGEGESGWVNNYHSRPVIDGVKIEMSYFFPETPVIRCEECGEENVEDSICEDCQERLEQENEADRKHLEYEFINSRL